MKNIKTFLKKSHLNGYWIMIQDQVADFGHNNGYVDFYLKHEAHSNWISIYGVNKIWSRTNPGELVTIDLSTEEGIKNAFDFFESDIHSHVMIYWRMRRDFNDF